MPVAPFDEFQPTVDPSVFIAPDAWVIGKVSIEKDASIFFGCVLRGDIEEIRIGAGSNLQERCVCHTTTGESPCVVGKDVTVGHGVILHGAQVSDNCIIGMGSTLLDNVIIEENCIIGANSLITKNMTIPSGHLAMGSPAKIIRPLRQPEIEFLAKSAEIYRELAKKYRQMRLGAESFFGQG